MRGVRRGEIQIRGMLGMHTLDSVVEDHPVQVVFCTRNNQER